MKKLLSVAFCLLANVSLLSAMTISPLVKFDFTSVSDTAGVYTGSLKNGATLATFAGQPILNLGTNSGYFDFGSSIGNAISQLDSYSMSVNLFIPSSSTITGDGNFVWCFAKSSSSGYQFFSAKESRCATTLTNYSGEQNVRYGTVFTQGQWINVTYTQTNGTGKLYIGGELKATNPGMTLTLKNVGITTQNYLGKSCYSGDAYLSGAQYNDFRIYNAALTANDAAQLATSVDTLNKVIEEEAMAETLKSFTLGDVSALTNDIKLPKTYNSVININWTTSDSTVITKTGVITRPAVGKDKATATLTAHFTFGSMKKEMTFDVGVMPQFTASEALDYDAEKLSLSGNLSNLYNDLSLPSVTENGTAIKWTSSDTSFLTNTGHIAKYGDNNEKQHITLTATLQRGTLKKIKSFDIYIHENEPYNSYMFVFFPSNDNENLYYALSTDGYNYTVLNNGNKVVSADSVSIMKGLRDPHILRGKDGYFYMVITDMKSSLGWSSNRGIVMMRSQDLIHWTHSTVNFPTKYAGTNFANVTRVWAPETIWDPNYENTDGTKGRYMVYFSLLTNDGTISYDKDYYCYANDDFTDLIGQPTYLYDRGSATIDMDIVYNEDDSLYHAFYKNEGSGGICQVTAKRLTAEDGQALGSQWGAPSGTLQQTSVAVEGVGVFKLINQDSWIMMYDCYGSGYYQFCSSPDLNTFTYVQNTTTGGSFTPRHGTVIPLTAQETAALMAAYPTSSLAYTPKGASNINIRQDYMEIGSSSIFIPVEQGTDISSFDPQLYGSLGTTVTPAGAQDFSKGTVNYTFTNTSGAKTYAVTVEADANPILPSFHADPEVLFSKQTGRFYVYPTTDGYTGWGGYSFNAFSSPDLLHFTDEGTILDLSAGADVDWASGNAWAPCIEEKWMDGGWKYFFYFSGNNTSLGKKTLGVATASTPVGPFKAESQPLFTSSSAGQMIDADVFTDPVSGQSYLYYGNGSLCYRLLSDDMTSVKGSEYTITPSGGSTSTYAFREGTYVFYRNGIYYFLWSVDDTGSSNYHVAYGTSTSPTGPITVGSQPIVIIQNSSNGIYGTGHNSIVNVPGTDDWYIIYHRINKNYLSNGPGYHREVCCDKLTFDKVGNINQVTPTRTGITPVNVEQLRDSLATSVNATEIPSSTKLVRVLYYNVDGVSLGSNAPVSNGIYVRQEQFADGTLRTIKIVK
jgi:hypothetical protein